MCFSKSGRCGIFTCVVCPHPSPHPNLRASGELLGVAGGVQAVGEQAVSHVLFAHAPAGHIWSSGSAAGPQWEAG